MDTKTTQENDDMDQTTPNTDTETQDATQRVDPEVAAADERLQRRLREEAETKTENAAPQKLVRKPRAPRKTTTNGHAETNGHTNGVHTEPAPAPTHSAADEYRDAQAKATALKSRAIDELEARLKAISEEAEEIREELAELRGEDDAPPAPKAKRAAKRTSVPRAVKAAAKAEKPAKTMKAKGERLARRSKEEIAEAVAKVVGLIKANETPLRSEQIRTALKFESKEMPRILKTALAQKKLRARGQKRSTEYSVTAK